MAENGKQWFAVHTYSGYEDRVKKNLEQRVKFTDSGEIFQIIVPTEEETEVKNGQKRKVVKKILPGYVLVEMRMSDQSWSVVRNTPGVTGFVGSTDKPTPLQQEEVNRLLKQMAAETPKVRAGFRVGQSIRVMDGPFTDFMGVVDEVNERKGKLVALLSLFGRETPVELDLLQVEKL